MTRADRDFYPTPAPATRALLVHESFDGPIWEPCAGRGDMADALRAAGYIVTATDIATGDDVLSMPLREFNVVTNPPYGHDGQKPDRRAAERIATHLLQQRPRKLALLLPFQWFCSVGRAGGLFRRHPVSRVWAFADRFAMWPEGKALNNSKPPSNSAWFVWDQQHNGPTQLGHCYFGDAAA
jgi:hypothetical protein